MINVNELPQPTELRVGQKIEVGPHISGVIYELTDEHILIYNWDGDFKCLTRQFVERIMAKANSGHPLATRMFGLYERRGLSKMAVLILIAVDKVQRTVCK